MKILMISKACLVGAYQTKLEEIAGHEGVALSVIVPPVWYDSSAPLELERSHTNGYQLLVDPIRFNGQYHMYHFPNLKERMAAIQQRLELEHCEMQPGIDRQPLHDQSGPNDEIPARPANTR